MKNTSGKVVAIACILTFAAGGTAAYLGLSTVGLINKEGINIEFEVASDSKTYDGKGYTYTKDDIELVEGSLLEGHVAKYEFTTTPSDVGVYEVGCNVKIVDANTGSDKTNNYNIKVKEGTYTIKQKTIKALISGATAVYSGNALVLDGSDVTLTDDTELVAGDYFVLRDENNLINVGEADFDNYTLLIYNSHDQDVTKNYNLGEDYANIQMGSVTVTKRNLVLKIKNITKNYDGKETEWNGYTFSSGSLASGDTLLCEPDYSEDEIINAGEYNVGIKQDSSFQIINSYGVDVTENYNVSYTVGQIKINPVQLTLTISDVEATCGDSFSSNNLTKTFSGFVEGESNTVVNAYNSYCNYTLVCATDLLNADKNKFVANAGTYNATVNCEKPSSITDDNYNIVSKNFSIKLNKIVVTKPAQDNTVYVYNGTTSFAYSVENTIKTDKHAYIQLVNDVDELTRLAAGKTDIKFRLKDSNTMVWEDGTIDDVVYSFYVWGSAIKPEPDRTIFTYSGTAKTYNSSLTASPQPGYTVYNNVHINPGTYEVRYVLNDGYKWSDGTSDDVTYSFTIREKTSVVIKINNIENLDSNTYSIANITEFNYMVSYQIISGVENILPVDAFVLTYSYEKVNDGIKISATATLKRNGSTSGVLIENEYNLTILDGFITLV